MPYYDNDRYDLGFLTRKPTATITLDKSTVKAGETITATITFNDAVDGFGFDDFVLTGAASSGEASLSELTYLPASWPTRQTHEVWTVVFRPTADVEDTNNTIGVDLTRVTTFANVRGVGIATSPSYTVDTRRPTATVTLDKNLFKAGQIATATVTFSEPITGFTFDDIDMTDANGRLIALTAGTDSRTWTVTFRPTADVEDTSNTIGVNLAGVTDAAGNAGTGVARSASYTVDTRHPTATVMLNKSVLKAGQTATVVVSFSEAVSFTLDAFILTDANGQLSELTASADGRIWTATFTPTVDVEDTSNTIRVNMARVTDVAGNAGAGGVATSANYTMDTRRPTATITLDKSVLKMGQTATVTVTFSESVTGFALDDFVLTGANGRLSAFTAGAGGRTWTATFTPTTDDIEDTSSTISVNLAGVTDAAGNAGTGTASSARYTVDIRRPTATITLDKSVLKMGQTATVTVSFSEPVTGFALDDVVLTDANGQLSAFTAGADGRTWTATLTPTANVEDTSNTISVSLAGVTDAAGNVGTGIATSASYTVDTRRPTATVMLDKTALQAGQTATVIVTFSESVTGFTLDDFVLTDANGRLSALTAGADGRTWTATFTPAVDVEDTSNTISVNLAGVTDAAGNAGTGNASSASYTVDTRRSTATITLDKSVLKAGQTATVTVSFSESVTGFTLDDFVLTDANGQLSAFTAGTNGRTWTATFTPTADVEDTSNTIRVNLAGITNAAGNAGTGIASSASYTVDTRRPTATITLDKSVLKMGQTATVTVSFSESVTGFALDDVVLTDANGQLSAFTAGTDGRTWTATFTPTADVEDTSNTIRVNLAGVTDAAGNAGTGNASSANYTVDTRRPTATITLDKSVLDAGQTATVTVSFSESVTGFTLDDVVLTDANGQLSALTAGANGRTWTATFTPTADVEDTSNTIRVNLAGVTDAAGNAGTGIASSASYTVDTRRSTATITLDKSVLKAGQTATVTVSFSESVTGFTLDDFVLTDANGQLSAFTAGANGRTWTATFTPTADVEDTSNTIRVNLAGITNAAGNAGTGIASSASYTVDTRRPTATITLDKSVLKIGQTATVTVSFSESVTGFALDDVVLTDANGQLSAFTAGTDGRTWTATFTPTADVEDTSNTIRVNLAGVTDAAGNAGTGNASSASYTVDTRRPTATITLDKTALKAGQTATVTISFSESVTGFTLDDFVLTDANGRLSALTAGTNDRTWTATFTPTADVEDTSNTIRVNLAGVTDAAGNAGTGNASSASYTVDTRRPTATVTLDKSVLKAGQTATVTVSFSESVTGFTLDDVVLTDANGRLSAFTAGANGRTWTATFTPTADVEDTSNTISVNMAGVTDGAGNAGIGNASSASYTVNTRRPTATITLDKSVLKAGQTATVTVSFSESVTGFALDDVVLTDANGQLSAFTAGANGRTWTATFTPTANVEDTSNTISVNLAGVTDAAGNAGTGNASSASYTVDTRRPTATITLDKNVLHAGQTATVTVTFSESVTGFTLDDVVLTDANGRLSAFTAGADGRTWTATFTPTANVEDTSNTIRVNLTGVTDGAGNAGIGNASSANYTVDTLRSMATITLDKSVLKLGQTATVTVSFSESVTGFALDDVVLTDANGRLSAFTAGTNGRTWTATFTPTADVEDTSNTIRVNLAGITDAAGNVGTGIASSASYTVDTRRPTATIALDKTALKAGQTATVTVNFSESVTGFTLDDFVLTDANGRLGAFTAGTDGRTWTATFTPAADVEDTSNIISVNLAGVTDVAGNAGTGNASSVNYTVDTRRPTATITLDKSVLDVGQTATVTVSFSEPVTGFTLDDVVLTDANGRLSAFTAGANGRTWTATFTPTADIEDTSNTIRVNLAGVTDAAGNAGTGIASSVNYTVDTRRPTATITLDKSVLKAGQTATVTVSFSEPVTGFALDDFVLADANGQLSAFTAGANGRTWTATFTPTADVEDTSNTIRVNLAGVTDAAGNAGTGNASSANYTVDTRRPTATIALDKTALKAGQTATVTVTFSESVTGFTLDDVVLTDANGRLGALTAGTDGRTWTATFTPTADVEDTSNTIRVNLAGVTDAAGNAGTGNASSANYTVDTRRPTATITLDKSVLKAGQTATVTVSFSESVTGFTLDDVVLTDANGQLSAFTAGANGRTWTATFTPTADVEDTSNTIRVNLAGVTDAAGNAGTGNATSVNYTVNTRRPTATITLDKSVLKAGQTATVTVSFSEPVTGFALDDFVLADANGQLSAFTAGANGRTWTATFTPTADVEDTSNTIRVNLAGITNAAGNVGTGIASSANYTVDTRRPTATITLDRSILDAGQTATVTVSFSEPVTGFALDDVVLTDANGRLSAFTAGTNGRTWTATFTPTADIEDTSNTISVNLAGVTDAAGNAGIGNASSANFTVNTRSPLPSSSPEVPDTRSSLIAPPEALDTDGDSVPDVQEDRGIGPDGAAGDGNGDGIQDSKQVTVGSISVTAASSSASSASSSITLVTSSQDGKVSPDSSARITGLEQAETPAHLPRGLEMPIGLVRFQTTLASVGSSETFSLYVDPALGVNGYWMQDHSGTWVNLASKPYGGKMVNEGGRQRLDFQITDGGPFDADGKADGVITATGAIAQMPLSIVGQASDTGYGGDFWF